jgi:hypothetical protein
LLHLILPGCNFGDDSTNTAVPRLLPDQLVAPARRASFEACRFPCKYRLLQGIYNAGPKIK